LTQFRQRSISHLKRFLQYQLRRVADPSAQRSTSLFQSRSRRSTGIPCGFRSRLVAADVPFMKRSCTPDLSINSAGSNIEEKQPRPKLQIFSFTQGDKLLF
jgi:hypothetical protein